MIHRILSRKALFMAAAAILMAAVPATTLHAQEKSEQQQIAESTLVKVGDKAPAFKVTMVDGSSITLSQLKGKVVVVNFWATWCPPCREELKHVQKQIIDRFAGEEFVFLPISRGEAAKTVKAFLQKNGYKFPAGLDPEQAIYKRYASNFIPRNFLIGPDGRVVSATVGFEKSEFEELIRSVEAALGEDTPREK